MSKERECKHEETKKENKNLEFAKEIANNENRKKEQCKQKE